MDLPRTRAVIERGMAEGLHAGAQLCALRDGAPAAELALGLARPGVALRPDTVVFWLSSVKPLMSVAIGQLVERGLVALDDPVARHVAEFAANGKAGVTLRHLLTHTACMPGVERQWSRAPWEEILANVCAAPLEPGWALGRDCAYHVASAWYVLGEIVRRADGRPYERYVREAVLAPLGIRELWVGMSAADHAANAARIATPHDASGGAPKPVAFWAWTGSAESVALCRPGGSGWGTARALARFYAMLLGGGALDGARVLRADTVKCLVERQLEGAHDRVFGTRLDRALGFVLDSKAYGRASAWYGTRGSGRAFGHGGYFSSVAFADPERGLAVALWWNGIAPERHEARLIETLDALYDDLG